jgi:nicotinamide-nucleotide amidase
MTVERVSSRAEILSIGEELLDGRVREGNAAYLAGHLQGLGFRVRWKSTVGDDCAEISASIRQAVKRADLVVTTGGLGPTRDDRTVDAVARALHVPLRISESLFRSLVAASVPFRSRSRLALRRQCRIPVGFRPLPNPVGTAPGLYRGSGHSALILLPGVPHEMRALFSRSVAPRLIRQFHHPVPPPMRILKIAGLPEPRVDRAASRACRLEGRAAPTVLAGGGIVAVQIGPSGQAVTRRIEKRLRTDLGAAVFGVDGDTIESRVGELLRDSGASVAVAESCTGGMLGQVITSVAGSSGFFRGGVIAYQETAKRILLDVPSGLLLRHGAVSRRVGGWMAREARRRLMATFGVSITGVAGPAGGTRNHPVGQVTIAVAGPDGTRTRRLRFLGGRDQIRKRACVAALDLVRRRLLSGEGRRG